jgi:hypothetical protein
MGKMTYALVTAATALAIANPAVASAAPEGGSGKTLVPLLSNYKSCDFIESNWVDARGYGRGTAHVSSTGSTVSADVDLATGQPNTHYDVRIIQVPRPSIGCAPGAPGVITGSLQTDGIGAGRTTLSGPVQEGATGAWVIMQRPAQFSQTPAEFYTSEFIAKI